ncbi:MAG TPA: hypothetical protein VJK03_01280 [Candidatus Nanoarchaeia archaeon]|nr:hypothetical protein [Candidatus Nanoarchaeia archaeon]
METKTIKGVDEETWARFKMLAAKNRITMGKLMKSMVREYEKKKTEEIWEKILHSGKILSDKEADNISEITRKMRKENWTRNAAHT